MMNDQENPAVLAVVAAPVNGMDSKQITVRAVSAPQQENEDAGKGLGIAAFVVILVGFIFSFIFPPISFVCWVAGIVLSSVLTCGCCCANQYELGPQKKKLATATLISLVMSFVVQLIGVVAAFAAVGTELSKTGSISSATADGAGAGVMIGMVIGISLNVLAIITSALFVWGRKLGVPHTFTGHVIHKSRLSMKGDEKREGVPANPSK